VARHGEHSQVYGGNRAALLVGDERVASKSRSFLRSAACQTSETAYDSGAQTSQCECAPGNHVTSILPYVSRSQRFFFEFSLKKLKPER
jgi:hypothetical protein